MSKWTVKQWRDGECIRVLEFEGIHIRRLSDNKLRIEFPPFTVVGGWTISTDDILDIERVE